MTKKIANRRVLGPKALEMVMWDVLGGMEEIAIMKSFDSAHLFEVVSIECADNDQYDASSWQACKHAAPREQGMTGKIIPLDNFRTIKS